MRDFLAKCVVVAFGPVFLLGFVYEVAAIWFRAGCNAAYKYPADVPKKGE